VLSQVPGLDEASALAAVGAGQTADRLDVSLVHAGFDLVRRAADTAAADPSVTAFVPPERQASLLGDVPVVAFDGVPRAADQLAAVGRLDPANRRDGPIEGYLRRDALSPFRL
jgi:hypothetical protein